jgi:hypothetical protein
MSVTAAQIALIQGKLEPIGGQVSAILAAVQDNAAAIAFELAAAEQLLAALTPDAPPVVTTPPPTPPTPPTPAVGPSGVPVPTTAPTGYRLVFTDGFDWTCPLGQFPGSAGQPNPGAEGNLKNWYSYPDGWKDTSKHGTYMPSSVLSVADSVLDMYLHTDATGRICVAAPSPHIPSFPGAGGGQLYGAYSACFKAPALAGFKTAWLLWPDSEVWPRDGEIDFPEADLDSPNIAAFMHWQGATSGNQQDAFNAEEPMAGVWHTTTTVWGPEACVFILDGKVIGSSSAQGAGEQFIPDTNMHWVLQTETSLSGVTPAPGTEGHLEVDWVAVCSLA